MSKNGDGSTEFYAAKCGAIGLSTVYFLALGVAFSVGLNSLFPTYDEAVYRRKSWLSIAIEVFAQAFLIGIAVFAVRRMAWVGFELQASRKTEEASSWPFPSCFFRAPALAARSRCLLRSEEKKNT